MEKAPLHSVVILRLFKDEKCFGPGVAELLEHIDEEKSIRKATAKMGMAYSKAWRIIKAAESAIGFELVKSSTGGAGGGGAEITDEARKTLECFRTFEKDLYAYAEKRFEEIFNAKE